MIINTLNNSKTKILLDTEDLKNHNISLQDWLLSPKNCLKNLLSKHMDIDISSIKILDIYSFKFITFYIIIEINNI